MSNQQEQQTIGQWSVGVAFNPSKDSNVDLIKESGAYFIDLCDKIAKGLEDQLPSQMTTEYFKSPAYQCFMTQIDLLRDARKYIEMASMLAVKAATKKPR